MHCGSVAEIRRLREENHILLVYRDAGTIGHNAGMYGRAEAFGTVQETAGGFRLHF